MSNEQKETLRKLSKQLTIMLVAGTVIEELHFDGGNHVLNNLPVEVSELYPLCNSFDEFMWDLRKFIEELDNYIDSI